MSKRLKKERIIAKSLSGISAKASTKSVQKQNSFEHNSTNDNGSIVAIAPETDKQLPQSITDEKKIVSPVKSSIKIKMKVKISGKVPLISVDSEDVVFIDE